MFFRIVLYFTAQLSVLLQRTLFLREAPFLAGLITMGMPSEETEKTAERVYKHILQNIFVLETYLLFHPVVVFIGCF